MDQEKLVDWVPNSKLLHIQFFIMDEHNHNATKAITAYEYDEMGREDKFIILTDRIHKDDIVGYAYLHKVKDNIWQVRDVAIFDPYKKKGLGFDLCVKLVNEGYYLINGYSLSTDIEKVWRKLHTEVKVNTFDLHSGEISDFDERPKHDSVNDSEQQYFWLASSKGNLQESLWRKNSDGEPWYIAWLEGSTSTPGGYGSSKFGLNGEF
jgi:hypothetical protein